MHPMTPGPLTPHLWAGKGGKTPGQMHMEMEQQKMMHPEMMHPGMQQMHPGLPYHNQKPQKESDSSSDSNSDSSISLPNTPKLQTSQSCSPAKPEMMFERKNSAMSNVSRTQLEADGIDFDDL